MKATRIALYCAAILLALWVLVPIGWTLIESFKTEAELHDIPIRYLPTKPTLYNYWLITHIPEVLAEQMAKREISYLPHIASETPVAILNSATIGITVVIVNLTIGALGAYGFSRIDFKGRYQLFWVAVCTQLIPPVAIIIPLYAIIGDVLHLLDTLAGMILVYSAVTLPFTIWILSNYLLTVPTDIEEAAMIDGYNSWEIYVRFIIPIIKPALVSVAIFSFMMSYTEFFYALNFTQSARSHTIPVIIASSFGYVMPVGFLSALSIVTIIVPLVIISVFTRYIIRGLVTGAVK